MPENDRAEYSKFSTDFKNYKATIASIVGKDPEGKEAIPRKDREYTAKSQDHWAPQTGALATNLGCRIHFVTSVALANVKWKVGLIPLTSVCNFIVP